MYRDVTSLIRPRTVAVVGASARRSSQGNVVIQNLQRWGFNGSIFPVHPTAELIDGLPAVNSVDRVQERIDLAIVAIPAADVHAVLVGLERTGVRSAIVFSNGFSAAEAAAIRSFAQDSEIVIHGPNCMGLVNFSDSIPLYPARPSLRLRPGTVALVAQSGSAAISVMNSTTIGFSKVVTVGSEFQISSADYLHWLAGDADTRVVGAVVESIKDPVGFAAAAERLHAGGKSLVVLKVGNSELGGAATQAHTGALISNGDAYDCFFAESDIATVRDYDELIASIECSAIAPRMVRNGRVALAGISGGQTALACDVAGALDVPLATFGQVTTDRVKQALPGSEGLNPIDTGATVNPQQASTREALGAVLEDPAVGALALLQDCQASLNPKGLESYMGDLAVYGALGRAAAKPVVIISPTGENIHPAVTDALSGCRVPVVRGLQPGLVALRNLGMGNIGDAGKWADCHRPDQPPRRSVATRLRQELAAHSGTLTPEFSFRILRSYDIPVTKAITVASEQEAVSRCGAIGFPMVVKVASRQISHRSDVGGVVLGVQDVASLKTAMAFITRNVAAAVPHATIDGFELQEEIADGVEAVAGFAACAPFGSLMLVGSGGTMVELMADRAVGLAPLSVAKASSMITTTRLGKLLNGYRNLIPRTDPGQLATLVANLSELATDLGDLITACDLNPVLVRKGSGAVRVVDALMITRDRV